MSERVVWTKCDWKYHIFLSINTEEWDLKVLLFIYWNGLALGSVKTFFLEVGAYVSLKWLSVSLWEGRFSWTWLKIYIFLNIKTEEWDLKTLLFNYWHDLVFGSVERYFWKSMHTCLWKEFPEVFERVVFVEFDWKYHIFLNIKTEEWGLNILLFNYWNDLALDSVETYVLEVGVYESLKEATTGVWEGCFCWLWPDRTGFSKY